MPGRDISAAALMQHAIGLLADTHPHPNPRVACVIANRSGEIVSAGVHETAGSPHAEVLALQSAATTLDDATLVVTLEPCAHHGRTPPCVDAILASGITRVVVGATDPDGRVSGSGIARLREAGVEVVTDVMAAEVEAADPGYFHHRRTGRPLVTLKLAATLDGQVAAVDGTSQWISGVAARNDAHRLRARSDAVLIGAGTLRQDDPLLDVRSDGYTGPQPRPVVLAGSTPLPADRRIWARDPLVYATRPVATPGGEVVVVSGTDGVDIGAVIKDLGSRGIIDLMVEGGPAVARSFLTGAYVDRIVWYLAAKLAGGQGQAAINGVFTTVDEAIDLEIIETTMVGTDLRIDAEVRVS